MKEQLSKNIELWWNTFFAETLSHMWPGILIFGIIALLILWLINLARHNARLHAMGVNTEAVVLSVKDHIANKNPHVTMKQYYMKVEYTDDKGKKRRSTCYHLAPLKVGQKIMIRYLPGHYTFVEFRQEDW